MKKESIQKKIAKLKSTIALRERNLALNKAKLSGLEHLLEKVK